MPKLRENVSLARLSHYQIGGPARYFFEPKNEKEVVWAVGEAERKRLPIFVMGGGTNLLVPDRGVGGLVLRLHFKKISAHGNLVTVGAGVPMVDLLRFSVRRSLTGLEWAGGLPGTVGGAIRGNAGCFGGEISDLVVSVRSFDTETMRIVERRTRSCGFNYRASVFKRLGGREIILSANLRLKKGNAKTIAASIKEKIAHRKRNHPLEYPNIGSMFKNIPLSAVCKKEASAYRQALRAKTIAFRGASFSIKTDPFPVISAAKLISEAGLRGARSGGAMISPKHPNFIVNVAHARAADVKELLRRAKKGVWKRFKVQLEEEVQIL